MRFCDSLLFTIVLFSVASFSQDNSSKPKLSDQPLTEEQADIYRTVLKHYPKNSGEMLNVSDTTVPLEVSGRAWFGPLRPNGGSFDKACVEGIELEQAPSPVPVVHKLSPSVLASAKMKFVEPEPQENRIEVFTLSEIIFDRLHRHALVSYSFGYSSSGGGATLVLEKNGDGWAVKKSCGCWVGGAV